MTHIQTLSRPLKVRFSCTIHGLNHQYVALNNTLHPCRQFAEACGKALDVNERLIKEDQLEYQEEMKAHYRDMLTELSGVMNEQVSL